MLNLWVIKFNDYFNTQTITSCQPSNMKPLSQIGKKRLITLRLWKAALLLYAVFFLIGFYFIHLGTLDAPFNSFLSLLFFVFSYQLLSYFAIKTRVFSYIGSATFTFSQLFIVDIVIIYTMSYADSILQATIINIAFLSLLFGVFSLTRIHFILLTITPIIAFAFFIGQNIYNDTLGYSINVAVLQWLVISILLITCSAVANYLSKLSAYLIKNRAQLLAQKEDLEIAHRELLSILRQASKKASHDELTGLYNRRYFSEILHTQISISNASDTPLGLLMLDIDYFKPVNDSYGHLAGDEVLKSFKHIHEHCLRKCDFIARYGGEEFIILLPGADKTTLLDIGERIRNFVENMIFDNITEGFHVTVSIGATHYANREKSADMIKRTDNNLYKAKRSGRNQLIYKAWEENNNNKNSDSLQKKYVA